MKTTTNLGLKKPEPSDFVDVSVLNDNMDKLDAEIPSLTENNLKSASLKDSPTDNDGFAVVDSDDGNKIKRVLWSKIKSLFASASHAAQHSENGRDPVTPAAIGAVKKSGDTMTGNLFIRKAVPEMDFANTSLTDGRLGYILMGSDKTFNFGNFLDGNNKQALYVQPETAVLKNALRMLRTVNGVTNYYSLLHEGNLSDFGIARIATGTYVGTGTCGPNNPNILTLPFPPKLLMIAPAASGINFGDTNTMTYFHESSIWFAGTSYTTLRANTSSYTAGDCSFTVSGNSISWHSDETNYPETQMNTSGTTYAYIAIG